MNMKQQHSPGIEVVANIIAKLVDSAQDQFVPRHWHPVSSSSIMVEVGDEEVGFAPTSISFDTVYIMCDRAQENTLSKRVL
jgi:hypothetical protein